MTFRAQDYSCCPRCGYIMLAMDKKLQRLEEETESLREQLGSRTTFGSLRQCKQQVSALEATIEHLRQELEATQGNDEYLYRTKFVGSRYGESFHRPECKWARRISEKNREWFDSHEEAVREGYKPCKTCYS